ncbi:PLP-dependent aminotransferase family protein [Bacillus sp. FJAT-28004]|uniref:MocR-like pyridoxine biosynthesis transcription factor PdxR n=1 Tax=Bacillus sp. FJAT-28004 TaxID=1679165 RepID=UPI0006B533AE|nr:PLP-dependent aminotransferase family protein [Bacillus sp. FJAT-28004]
MIEITPLLDKQGKNPLYSQLYTYIKDQIESGLIAESAKLPSIRELANYLKISKNTVEAAYQQLLAEGYVESKSRNGLRVLPLEDLNTTRGLVQYSSIKDVSERKYRYDFNYGDIEWNRFPMSIWKRCLSDSLNKDPYQILGYGHPQGDEELREEIAKYLFQSRGVSCSPNQILICSGTQHAVSMLLQFLSLGGQNIAMEEPGYNGVRTVLKNHGCKITPISVDYDGLNIEELQSSEVNAVYVTPSHQFPLGMVLSIQKRMKLLHWASQNDAIIIEDDYDSEFRYVGQPIPSLKALDSGERVVYLGTFSKSFLPAARLSYMVLPTTILEKLDHIFSVYNQPASPIIQQAVFLFMNRGHFSGHIRKMRRLYQAKHKTLVNAISLYMGDRVNIIGSKSGLHLLLDIKDRESGHLIELAAGSGVRVYSPNVHWMDSESCPTSIVLLGFGGMSEGEIEEGICLLSNVWFGSA